MSIRPSKAYVWVRLAKSRQMENVMIFPGHDSRIYGGDDAPSKQRVRHLSCLSTLNSHWHVLKCLSAHRLIIVARSDRWWVLRMVAFPRPSDFTGKAHHSKWLQSGESGRYLI